MRRRLSTADLVSPRLRCVQTTLPQRVLETIAGAAGAGAQIGIAFSWTGVFLIFFTLALLPRRALCSRAFALLPCCVVSWVSAGFTVTVVLMRQ